MSYFLITVCSLILFSNLVGSFHTGIRIRILNTDPDPFIQMNTDSFRFLIPHRQPDTKNSLEGLCLFLLSVSRLTVRVPVL
jgi:hypothetical protein